MENISLSIILPIYNVEKYLSQCLESVLATKGSEKIEIILVDDGSTDKSGEIAEEYSRRYNMITTYHKRNGGLSDARNYGLLRACGKYVFFMDSDDLLTPDYFKEVLEIISSYDGDIVIWDAEIIDENGVIIPTEKQNYYKHLGVDFNKGTCTGKQIIESQLMDHNDYVTTVWLGAYNRNMLLHEQLWFEKGLLHEDELWTPKVLLKAYKIKYFPKPLYRYRVRANSIMTAGKKDRSRNISSLIYVFSDLYAYYDWKLNDAEFAVMVKANLSKRFLYKISQYNVYAYNDLARRIPKRIIWHNSRGIKDRLRAFVLLLSGRLYCFLTKRVRE
jgi:glycosyltransferase involved in cell wall biosynthesis